MTNTMTVDSSNYILEDEYGDRFHARFVGGQSVAVNSSGGVTSRAVGPMVILEKNHRVRLAEFLVSGTDYEVVKRAKS